MTSFEVQSDATISVPAGTFTTTPIKETNTANLTYSMNYWSAQVGNWVRVGDYDGTGRNTDNFNLTSSNYQGGNFFTSIVFGLPVWIWLLLLIIILVAVVRSLAVPPPRAPTRAMPPAPPHMPPHGSPGPQGPPPPSPPAPDLIFPHRRETSIHAEPRRLVHLVGFLPVFRAEVPDQPHRFVRGRRAADHLDELHDRRRIEEVHADDAVRAFRRSRHLSDAQGGRIRGEDDRRRAEPVQLRVQFLLDFHLLQDRLDHQLRAINL